MDQKSLRKLYLSDLAKAPGVLAAIRRAARRSDRTLVMAFGPFDDDPVLLYAACGLARQDGVTLVLPPQP